MPATVTKPYWDVNSIEIKVNAMLLSLAYILCQCHNVTGKEWGMLVSLRAAPGCERLAMLKIPYIPQCTISPGTPVCFFGRDMSSDPSLSEKLATQPILKWKWEVVQSINRDHWTSASVSLYKGTSPQLWGPQRKGCSSLHEMCLMEAAINRVKLLSTSSFIL